MRRCVVALLLAIGSACAQQTASTLNHRSLSPSLLLSWNRFDIYVKWAYASWLVAHPSAANHGQRSFAAEAYLEHERVWNNFSEGGCVRGRYNSPKLMRYITAQTHPACIRTAKSSAASFINSFNTLIASMRARGFDKNAGIVPACASTGEQLAALNGAHRVAAAIATGVAHVPIVLADCFKEYRNVVQMYDFRFFASRGYSRTYSDWVVHRAISHDPFLHVVHVWPRAVEVGGEAALSQIRVLMSSAECSTDHGILYEKSLSLSPEALHVYLRHAYGNVNWVAPRPSLQPCTPID